MRAARDERERIVAHGLGIASAQGLRALSIGDVARDLELPRSGLFSHFATKESFQLAVLEQAAEMFVQDVIRTWDEDTPNGRPRLEMLFTNWLKWARAARLKGGCPFVHASAESEGLPASVLAKLREVLDGWTATLTEAIEAGKEKGEFRSDLDSSQLVFELYGLYLSHHFWHWSMKDPQAYARTLRAFERVLEASR
jgi:AcrR family transcriptional regulator